MKYLDFNPIGNIIQPVGLYNNLEEKRSILLFSKYDSDKDKWGFEETFDNMDLEDIYYVFSPSITPMPPETRIFKLNVNNNTQDKYTESITRILGVYDIKGLVENKGNYPSDILFCTYVRKFNNVIPLNIFIDKDDNDNFSLYMTSKKNAFEFQDRYFGYNNTPRQIFVMKNYPTNFKKTVLNMCVPTDTDNDSEPQTIQECLNSLEVFDQNINRLWNYNVNENQSNDTDNNNTINIIILSITGAILAVLLLLIFLKYKN